MKQVIYKEKYIVYEDGRVFNIKLNRFHKLTKHQQGYLTVKINCKNMKHHRVMAECFIPNPENKATVNHINGIKSDNRIENLEWSTQRENNLHAYANGLMDNVRKATINRNKSTKQKLANLRARQKAVLNTQTGIYYESVKEAAISANMKYSTLVSNLYAKNTNRTSFIYV
jgi:hypothetical protein